jgi:hypothetical protein
LYSAPNENGAVAVVTSAANPGNQLWQLYPGGWGISSGSGTINMAYSGAGAITTSVNLTGLNNSAVMAYPFIFYGGDIYGDQIGGQPPVFPEQLSAMSSMMVDTKYSLSGTPNGNVDVLFDEYLIPSATYNGGPGGALEVEVLPYFNFAASGPEPCCSYVKTLTLPNCYVNGVACGQWDEYIGAPGQPAGGNDILFAPHALPGLSNGEFKADFLPFMNEAANTTGINSSWWLAGVNLGNEFGGATTQNFIFTVTMLEIQQTMAAGGTAAIILTPASTTPRQSRSASQN